MVDPEKTLKGREPYYIDIYADYGLLTANDTKLDIKKLAKDLLKKHHLKGVYADEKLVAGKEATEQIIIEENGLKFMIDFKRYRFQGDHKKSRELIRNEVFNKRVLDLFAFDGAYALYALSDTPESVSIVEQDTTLVQENLKLNDFKNDPRCQLWSDDTVDFINIAIETRTQFDVIILNLRQELEKKYNLKETHTELIKKLQNRILAPGGFIFLVTDIEDFVLDRYIRPGADKLTKKTLPELSDFEAALPQRPHQSFVFYN